FPLAILVVVVILFRHWKELRLLDPHSITEERERIKRTELLEQRFERLKAEKIVPLQQLTARIAEEGKRTYRRAVKRLSELERFYKQAKSPFAMLAPSVKERIHLLLADAASLAHELKWADAERRYLEALTIDARSVDAYKGLGMIYLQQKLFSQAKETFEFIVMSKKADDVVYASLAEIADADGDVQKTEEMRVKAVEANPRLAIRHAELAAFFLAHGDTAQARASAATCIEIDPSSPRCLELSIEVAILSGDHTEAKRRYDKLRLVSDDQEKLKSFKEKIERIPT
ncbi:MAG: hypothetical protein AAB879_02405, partial [Patescibacteria group bacterium]